LYKHYGKGFEVFEEIPLFIVVDMIKHAIKKETEQQIYPMWLVHVLISKLQGQEVIPIEEMLGKLQSEKTTTKTAEEIKDELLPFVEIDRKKREVVTNG
jgi:hypothetical protein